MALKIGTGPWLFAWISWSEDFSRTCSRTGNIAAFRQSSRRSKPDHLTESANHPKNYWIVVSVSVTLIRLFHSHHSCLNAVANQSNTTKLEKQVENEQEWINRIKHENTTNLKRTAASAKIYDACNGSSHIKSLSCNKDMKGGWLWEPFMNNDKGEYHDATPQALDSLAGCRKPMHSKCERVNKRHHAYDQCRISKALTSVSITAIGDIELGLGLRVRLLRLIIWLSMYCLSNLWVARYIICSRETSSSVLVPPLLARLEPTVLTFQV